MIITILTEKEEKEETRKKATQNPSFLYTEAPSIPRDIYAGHSDVNQ